MEEITIKAHTRKGKGGKSVTVRAYTRRVGKKGHISPKRDTSNFSVEAAPGDELVAKAVTAAEKPKKPSRPRMTDEEIARWDRAARASSNTAAASGRRKGKKSGFIRSIKNPLSEKGSRTIAQRIEDRIEKFVEKYSDRKYKKMF